jgi:hypothetical protein
MLALCPWILIVLGKNLDAMTAALLTAWLAARANR